MQWHDRYDPPCVIAPDHGIATEPVVDVKALGAMTADAHQTAIVANRPLDVGMQQDRVDEAGGYAALCATQLAVL
jgi:hypothetical protein